jgi:GTPase SAR1 family protein
MEKSSDLSMDMSINLVRYKIVFVGDVAVGKTSIINRLMENKFSETYDV